jgi:hypothetical protein
MSMLFGTTILCDACALGAALLWRASESILRGLDSLFPPDADDANYPMLASRADSLTRNKR